MLKLVDIEKSYSLGTAEIAALRRVSLDIRDGDLLSITGPSGSGKSTLMNVLGLLSRPTAGTYLLHGRDVSMMTDDDLSAFRNAYIGFVFQSFNLMPHLTALENVGLPLVYRGLGRGESARRSRDMLERVGMTGRSGHLPGQLSGGQRQRVAIARALVGEPAVILADEPTGTLDTPNAREVMDLLVELNRRDRTTIVVITHDPSMARRCTRRASLEDGLLRERPAAGRSAGPGTPWEEPSHS